MSSTAEQPSRETVVTATLTLDAARHQSIVALSKTLGVPETEVFNVALSLLDWAVAERAAGRAVGSVNEEDGTYVELELSHAAPAGTSLQ